MYIFVVCCLHVTKSKQISNILKSTKCPEGAFCEHVVFAAAQREQAKRASDLLNYYSICLPSRLYYREREIENVFVVK